MFHPIAHIEKQEEPVNHSIDSWVKNYKEVFVQHPHDTSQLTLVLPDDCLLVAGPTRLRHASSGDSADFFPIGFANSINHSESRQVQPLKAIGSRRHIFAATNAPVQISIGRMLVLGMNTLRSLYANATFGEDMDTNAKYSHRKDDNSAAWYSNLEEDIFRVPIGLGIIYNSPATLSNQQYMTAGAEYFEVCTLVNKNVAIQSGQAMIMEQVTLMADRCIPWVGVSAAEILSIAETDQHAQVQQVSEML
jgi:hypothetical protein